MKIFHFTIPLPSGNFGDDVLTLATKKEMESIFSDQTIEWIDYPLRHHTTDRVIDVANSCDMVLVGGGGLLLRDTAANTHSGWQWNCSINHFRMINKPLVVYAIGYNRFRGQDDFDPIFDMHINEVVNKAAFFSVRNCGSRISLEKYGVDLDKVFVVPCPSIGYGAGATNQDIHKIGINLAGDRPEHRFGDQDSFAKDMIMLFDCLKNRGYQVHFFNHNWNPESNCQWLIDAFGQGVVHNIETNWSDEDVEKALRLYKQMGMVIAMRGHAQMIPFGLGVPVISLISHDKLRWFLDDVCMSSTGVEVGYGPLVSKMMEMVDADYPVIKQRAALSSIRDLRTTISGRVRQCLGM